MRYSSNFYVSVSDLLEWTDLRWIVENGECSHLARAGTQDGEKYQPSTPRQESIPIPIPIAISIGVGVGIGIGIEGAMGFGGKPSKFSKQKVIARFLITPNSDSTSHEL